MARLTITLNDPLHQALKETAARLGRTIGELVEESLVLRGIKPKASAQELVALARRRAALEEDAAVTVALEETRATRVRR
jgi:hypothetical protein